MHKEIDRLKKERDADFEELCNVKRELAEERARFAEEKTRLARELIEERVQNDILKRQMKDWKAASELEARPSQELEEDEKKVTEAPIQLRYPPVSVNEQFRVGEVLKALRAQVTMGNSAGEIQRSHSESPRTSLSAFATPDSDSNYTSHENPSKRRKIVSESGSQCSTQSTPEPNLPDLPRPEAPAPKPTRLPSIYRDTPFYERPGYVPTRLPTPRTQSPIPSPFDEPRMRMDTGSVGGVNEQEYPESVELSLLPTPVSMWGSWPADDVGIGLQADMSNGLAEPSTSEFKPEIPAASTWTDIQACSSASFDQVGSRVSKINQLQSAPSEVTETQPVPPEASTSVTHLRLSQVQRMVSLIEAEVQVTQPWPYASEDSSSTPAPEPQLGPSSGVLTRSRASRTASKQARGATSIKEASASASASASTGTRKSTLTPKPKTRARAGAQAPKKGSGSRTTEAQARTVSPPPDDSQNVWKTAVQEIYKTIPSVIVGNSAFDTDFHVSRNWMWIQYGANENTLVAEIPASKNPHSPSALPSDRYILFPNHEPNPNLPLGPGEPGIILTKRDDFLGHSAISIFVKYSILVASGKSRRVVWRYMGEYKPKLLRLMSAEEFACLPKKTQTSWAKAIASSNWSCFVSILVRVHARRYSRHPSSSSSSTDSAEIADEDLDLEKSRKRVTAHTCKDRKADLYKTVGLRLQDIIDDFRSGKEALDIVILECKEYDEYFARDLKDKWEGPGSGSSSNVQPSVDVADNDNPDSADGYNSGNESDMTEYDYDDPSFDFLFFIDLYPKMSESMSGQQPLVWLITGTSSGFGKRFVISALRRGDFVIATSRTMQSIENLPSQIQDHLKLPLGRPNDTELDGVDLDSSLSARLNLMELDVNWDTEAIHAAVKKALSIHGRVDVLVNNAGYAYKNLVEDVGSNEFKTQFQTNFFGLIDVTNAVLPQMRQRRSGTIIMMGSRSSWTAELAGTALYAASKAAVRVYTETLATELAPFSIRCLIIEPGAFRTEGIHSVRPYTPPQFSQPNGVNSDPRPEYAPVRERIDQFYKNIDGKQKGDPVKAVELIVDVVRGEGKAKQAMMAREEEGLGLGWPLYLILGKDAQDGVREKCQKMLDVVEEWEDLIGSLEFD
ncbi:hypothetical protein D9758_009020 [Tetrapyrgos nigripes]|uniref:DUF6697 domain-containing protein n=1 Tax=Tetrapyrgos nigripes TaxID=182062 RepID=A0A8H5LL35_9AGAR|nr:hypothetical protein D9758_009020 [Tetrapyrgos nigripes]